VVIPVVPCRRWRLSPPFILSCCDITQKTLGGQTGLNLAVELADAGVLDKYNVRSLGTPIDTIRKAEDRQLFKDMLEEIGEPLPESETVTNRRPSTNAPAIHGVVSGTSLNSWSLPPRIHTSSPR